MEEIVCSGLLLYSEDEYDLLTEIMNNYFAVDSSAYVKFINQESFLNTIEKEDVIEKSENYRLIKGFVKKFAVGICSGNDLEDLQKLLVTKGYDFTNDELNSLIKKEYANYLYEQFIKVIREYSPTTKDEYIKCFLIEYQDEIREIKNYKTFYKILFDNSISEIEKINICVKEKLDIEFGKQLLKMPSSENFMDINVFKFVYRAAMKINNLKKLLSENGLEFSNERGDEMDNSDIIKLLIKKLCDYELEIFEYSLLNQECDDGIDIADNNRILQNGKINFKPSKYSILQGEHEIPPITCPNCNKVFHLKIPNKIYKKTYNLIGKVSSEILCSCGRVNIEGSVLDELELLGK